MSGLADDPLVLLIAAATRHPVTDSHRWVAAALRENPDVVLRALGGHETTTDGERRDGQSRWIFKDVI